MTEFEKLLEADHIYKKLKKKEAFDRQKIELNNSNQKDIAQKGVPKPVLKPIGIKQIQNTSKLENRLDDNAESLKKHLSSQTERALRGRFKEIADLNPKEYNEHLKQKKKQEIKKVLMKDFIESKKCLTKNRGR